MRPDLLANLLAVTKEMNDEGIPFIILYKPDECEEAVHIRSNLDKKDLPDILRHHADIQEDKNARQ